MTERWWRVRCVTGRWWGMCQVCDWTLVACQVCEWTLVACQVQLADLYKRGSHLNRIQTIFP